MQRRVPSVHETRQISAPPRGNQIEADLQHGGHRLQLTKTQCGQVAPLDPRDDRLGDARTLRDVFLTKA
jgi:hypothetical protein